MCNKQESCCQGQHTYVHAQQMLTALAAHANGARFKRLSQELEAHAATQQGPLVWQMHAWCDRIDRRCAHHFLQSSIDSVRGTRMLTARGFCASMITPWFPPALLEPWAYMPDDPLLMTVWEVPYIISRRQMFKCVILDGVLWPGLHQGAPSSCSGPRQTRRSQSCLSPRAALAEQLGSPGQTRGTAGGRSRAAPQSETAAARPVPVTPRWSCMPCTPQTTRHRLRPFGNHRSHRSFACLLTCYQ